MTSPSHFRNLWLVLCGSLLVLLACPGCQSVTARKSSMQSAPTGPDPALLKLQQDVIQAIAGNIAMGECIGFKRIRIELQGINPDTKLPEILMVRDFSQGTLFWTGNPFCFAIDGAGFFVIELPDGRRAYTRDGFWELSPEGRLAKGAAAVLADPLPALIADKGPMVIGSDGRLETGPAKGSSRGQLRLAIFKHPEGLENEGGGWFFETEASGPPRLVVPGTAGAGEIVQGFVEHSNVDIQREMNLLHQVHGLTRSGLPDPSGN